MRLLPRWPRRVLRQLVRRAQDAEKHNRYLARMNDDLTAKNNTLSIQVETREAQMAGLQRNEQVVIETAIAVQAEAETLRWRLEEMRRAVEDIGTEDD